MSKLARAMGLKGASSYQRYENPEMFTKEYLPLDIARKLAAVVVNTGHPPITESEILALAGQKSLIPTRRMIPVIGYVGVGAEIYADENNPKGPGVDEVQSPYEGLSHLTVAVRVRGSSVAPAYNDGDIIFFEETHIDYMNLLGKDCVVFLADGRKFLKELRRTPDGQWYLHSHNTDPIFGIDIKSVGKVKLVWKAD